MLISNAPNIRQYQNSIAMPTAMPETPVTAITVPTRADIVFLFILKSPLL